MWPLGRKSKSRRLLPNARDSALCSGHIPTGRILTYESSPVKVGTTPTVMPRNDVLDIEPAVLIKPGERIPVVIACEQECHVKCVEDLGRE
jgi:hypothetical protein